MKSSSILTLLALTLLLLSVAWAGKKSNAVENDYEVDDEVEKKAADKKEKFYKPKDLIRITEMIEKITEIQSFLDKQRNFLTDLLISALSVPKPPKTDCTLDNLKDEVINVTKSFNKLFEHNTLTGRPAKLLEKSADKFN